MAELLRQPLPDGYIVGISQDALYHQINRICERAGLPKVGIHGLRRSFASLCWREGLPPELTAKIGGWDDLGTMRKHYIKIAEKEKQQAVDQLKKFATRL